MSNAHHILPAKVLRDSIGKNGNAVDRLKIIAFGQKIANNSSVLVTIDGRDEMVRVGRIKRTACGSVLCDDWEMIPYTQWDRRP